MSSTNIIKTAVLLDPCLWQGLPSLYRRIKEDFTLHALIDFLILCISSFVHFFMTIRDRVRGTETDLN